MEGVISFCRQTEGTIELFEQAIEQASNERMTVLRTAHEAELHTGTVMNDSSSFPRIPVTPYSILPCLNQASQAHL